MNTSKLHEMEDAADRMEEIRNAIKELVGEAYDLAKRHAHGERARGYWYAHILTALDNESGFLGRSMCSMEDTQREIEEAVADEREDADEHVGDSVYSKTSVCVNCGVKFPGDAAFCSAKCTREHNPRQNSNPAGIL